MLNWTEKSAGVFSAKEEKHGLVLEAAQVKVELRDGEFMVLKGKFYADIRNGEDVDLGSVKGKSVSEVQAKVEKKLVQVIKQLDKGLKMCRACGNWVMPEYIVTRENPEESGLQGAEVCDMCFDRYGDSPDFVVC